MPYIRMCGMTDFPASHRDLLDAQVATLATNHRHGFPHVSEVWFLYDEGELKTSLNTVRLKTRNLQRDPKCSLLILDLQNPYRYLEVRGIAHIEPDDDLTFARRLGAKYDTEFWTHDGPGEKRVEVTIKPVNLHAWPPAE